MTSRTLKFKRACMSSSRKQTLCGRLLIAPQRRLQEQSPVKLQVKDCPPLCAARSTQWAYLASKAVIRRGLPQIMMHRNSCYRNLSYTTLDQEDLAERTQRPACTGPPPQRETCGTRAIGKTHSTTRVACKGPGGRGRRSGMT